jgi:D-sedoheptulose 7-phosphate isomerase
MNKFTPAYYLDQLNKTIAELNISDIQNAVDLIEHAWKGGKQIIVMGNGGSALTALHYINDWNKSIFLSSGIQFRGRTLVDNIGLIMSYANDISFEDVFKEQLKNILAPGDLVIGISGSGNSENVIRAIEYANENSAITLGITGFDGGRLLKYAAHNIHIEKNDMQLSEDIHFIFGHIVYKSLCFSK